MNTSTLIVAYLTILGSSDDTRTMSQLALVDLRDEIAKHLSVHSEIVQNVGEELAMPKYARRYEAQKLDLFLEHVKDHLRIRLEQNWEKLK